MTSASTSTRATHPLSRSRTPGLCRIGLMLIVLVFLGRIATNDFIAWDDPGTLYQNPSLNPPSVAKLVPYWTHFGARAPMGLYVPVTYTVWSGLAWMGYIDAPDDEGVHLNPYVFHVASLVVHALCVLVVFELLRKIVRSNRAAFIGAALFAVHPVQVETVAWASGFKDLLCALFGLSAVWLFVLSREREMAPITSTSSWKRTYALGTALLVLAMLSKPTAMVIPVVALVLDRVAMGRPLASGVRRLAPWLVLSLLCAISARLAQPTTGMPRLPLWTRPLVAGDSLWFYAQKLAFPLTLAGDYGRTPHWIFEARAAYYTPLLAVAVVVLLWILGRRVPYLRAGLIVFGVAVSPVLGFVPFMFQFYSTVADHYLYLPMFGVALVAAGVVLRFRPRAVNVVAFVVILLLGVRSLVQAGTWKDDFSFNLNKVRQVPQAFSGQLSIVRHYLTLYQSNKNDRRPLDIAELHATNAVNLRPDVALARDTLAQVYVVQGRTHDAITQIKELIRLTEAGIGPVNLIRDTTASHHALGKIYMKEGQYDLAIKEFGLALRGRPRDPNLLRELDDARVRGAGATTRPR